MTARAESRSLGISGEDAMGRYDLEGLILKRNNNGSTGIQWDDMGKGTPFRKGKAIVPFGAPSKDTSIFETMGLGWRGWDPMSDGRRWTANHSEQRHWGNGSQSKERRQKGKTRVTGETSGEPVKPLHI